MKGLIVNRAAIGCCLLAWMLALPVPASAAPNSPSSRVEMSGSATGTIAVISGSSFTLQTPGRASGVINALAMAADNITKRDYPYVYGGGHAQAGIASVGTRGRGHNGRRIGFDCSGSVAAVLATAGLWPTGAGVPNDAGVITQLLRDGVIARGVGAGATEVTLYDHPGVHIFMNIDGRFFGTSDGGGGGNPRGGAGWLSDGAPDASSPAYKRYHVLPGVLHQSTNAAHEVTFQLDEGEASIGALALGEKVQVSYEELASGTLVATAVAYPGATTTSGTVESIAPDGSSLTIQTASGASLTFSAIGLPAPVDGLAIGDLVEVTYTTADDATIALSLNVTGAPPASDGSGGSGTNAG